MQTENTVYLIDPDEEVGTSLTDLLAIYGIRVRMYRNAADFQAAHPAVETQGCLVLAAKPPDSSGVSVLRQLRASGFTLPVILLTENGGAGLSRQIQELGPAEMIDKPLVAAFLAQRLSELLPTASNVPSVPADGLVLADGRRVRYRVMRPDDAQIEQEFVRGLSTSSRHLRFFSAGLRELSPRTLHQFTHPSYPDSYALIATICDEGRERIIGVARYAAAEQPGSVEFAVVVADDWQGNGIATQLMHGLLAAAVIAGMIRVEGLVLQQNQRMLELVRELGFEVSPSRDEPAAMRVVKQFRTPKSAAGS